MKDASPAERLRLLTQGYTMRHGPLCRVCALPPELLKEAHALVAGHSLKAGVAASLREMGHPEITNGVFNRHFREGHERG